MLLIVIDGLGDINLKQYAGHARTLWTHRKGRLTTVFPSTTAAALTSLTTGVLPGQHGMVGYRVRHPKTGTVLNQLSGWGNEMDPDHWQLQPTLMQLSSIPSRVFAEPKHQHSGFTKAVLRGAEYVGYQNLDERFRQATRFVVDAAERSQPVLGYLYIPDLDQAAHKHGVGSEQWVNVLEHIDQLFEQVTKQLPAGVGVVLTSDHGVINVPQTEQIVIDEGSALFAGVTALGGEPRGLQLYLADSDESAVQSLQARWRQAVGEQAWVFTQHELEASGMFGTVADSVRSRLGDIFVLARANAAFYRSDDLGGLSMVGQHGSLTEEETQIPLILAGDFTEKMD